MIGILLLTGLKPVSAALNYTNYTSDDTWVAPAGISWAYIEAWAGGGGGGGSSTATTLYGGGGGAGGQYAARNLTSVAAGSYAVVVASGGTAGAAAGGTGGTGGNSTFNGTTVRAVGGAGGIGNAGAGGTGTNTTGFGDVVYAGGNGYQGGSSGGAGGGGAGSGGGGGNATGVGANPGSGTASGGGTGGNGVQNGAGSIGNNYGGGGGGGEKSSAGGGTNQSGGAGAQGFVKITYMIPEASDSGAPTVNINTSLNNTVFTTSTPRIDYTFNDNISNTANCTLYFNDIARNTTNDVANGTATQKYLTVNSSTSVSDGNYSVYINCTDQSSNIGKSGVLNIEVDTLAPAITGVVNWSINSSAAKVNWTTNEEANGSVKYDATPVTHSDLLTSHVINLTGLSASQLYYYNITSCDAQGLCNTTGPYNFTTTSGPDITAPTVNINASLNNTFTNNTRLSVSFNFTDAVSNTANCTLYFNSLPYNTTNSINKDIQTTLTVNTTLSPANYTVYVNCTDNSSNVGKSGVIWIVVDNVTPTVNINMSLNNTVFSTSTPTISFNFIDSLSSTANCTLYFNNTAYNQTNNINTNTTTNLIVNPSLSNGRYDAYINCTDKAANMGKSEILNISINVVAVTYNVTNPPVNTKYKTEGGIDVTTNGQSGIVKILIGLNTTTGNYSGIIAFNFTSNIDVTGIIINTSRINAKSVVHNAAGVTGFLNLSLLIPRVNNSGIVYICPNAQSLAEVNTSCSGLINISVGQTVSGMTVSVVTYDSESYYLVENVTGTGGGEGTPTTTNPLQCFFIQSKTCPVGSARLIGLENDTHNGYNNSHVQNNSFNTYNYSICCNNTNASITINSTCPGNATVIKLNSSTNAHVEIGNNSNYSISVCLGSSWKRVFCNYPTTSCSSGYTCIMSMAGSEGTNSSNAHVAGCGYYSQNVCCALVNNAPTRPTLYYPANNTNITYRRPNFNWSASTDPDGDTISYSLNVTCGSCTASCYQPNIGSISTTNYTIPNALCFDINYNWSITACDSYGDCNTSFVLNFTVKSYADLILIVNATNFTNMARNQNNDTLDRSPTQLVAANIGNVLLNVTINATALFSGASMNTYYFQYEASVNKTSSFTTGCSQTTFANMSLSAQNLFCNLTYENNTALGNNTGNIEFNITVPSSESPGPKTSNIEVGYYGIE